jgi:hypothetical protein
LRLAIPVQALPNEPTMEKADVGTLELAKPTDHFERVLNLFEDQKQKLGISYYSTSQPALEDVFLDVLSRNRDLEDK